MVKTCQNPLFWWKITPCSSPTFLPYLVLLCSLVVLKRISSVYCFSSPSNNQMHFLSTLPGLFHSTFCACLCCLPSDLSGASHFPLSCCWQDRVLLEAFLGCLLCVTLHSPVSPTSSTSINLSWQDWLPVPPSWNDSYGGKGWGHLFPSVIKPVAALVSLWDGRVESSPSSLGWLDPLHILSVYPWSFLLRSSKH